MLNAGLVGVIPETPVYRLVTCVMLPSASSTRYRSEMPLWSEMK